MNSKPRYPVRINPSSEFAKGIQTFQIVNSARCQNIVDNNLDVLLRNGAFVKTSGLGNVIQCDGTNDVIDCGTASRTVVDSSTGYFTVAVLVYNRGASGNGTFISKRDGATVEFQMYNNGGSVAWRVGLTDATSGITFAQSDGWCWIIGVFNQDNANDVRIHKYRLSDKSLTSSTISLNYTVPTRQDVNMSVGARWQSYPTTGFPAPYDFAAWGVWDGAKNGAWSDSKVLRFARDPWSIVQKRRKVLVKSVAAPTGRIMGSLAGHGGLAGIGGIAGARGGLAG